MGEGFFFSRNFHFACTDSAPSLCYAQCSTRGNADNEDTLALTADHPCQLSTRDNTNGIGFVFLSDSADPPLGPEDAGPPGRKPLPAGPSFLLHSKSSERVAIFSQIILMTSPRGLGPRSFPVRRRTATCSLWASRSPTISIYGTF